ncbi:hypothetical protein [Catellatospora citrea]|nr:hypothetical protein [Catellatospora citrea]
MRTSRLGRLMSRSAIIAALGVAVLGAGSPASAHAETVDWTRVGDESTTQTVDWTVIPAFGADGTAEDPSTVKGGLDARRPWTGFEELTVDWT